MTGLNTEQKIMLREQDSGETEREKGGERQSVAADERWHR